MTHSHGTYLICAATEVEMRAWPGAPEGGLEPGKIMEGDIPGEHFLVTGVGIPMAMKSLYLGVVSAGRNLPSFDQILMIGIAGAYPGAGPMPGDIVVGTAECYGDIGVEDPGSERGFVPLEEFSFGNFYSRSLELVLPWFLGDKAAKDSKYTPGRGVTVSTCTGTEKTGILRRDRFDAVFETMEGASVAEVGVDLDVPVAQIRSVSNIASTRNMTEENMVLALNSLRRFLSMHINR